MKVMSRPDKRTLSQIFDDMDKNLENITEAVHNIIRQETAQIADIEEIERAELKRLKEKYPDA